MANRKTSNQQRKRPECHTPDLTITLAAGTVAGALFGALFYGATGGIAGSQLGKVVDAHVLKNLECQDCGHSFSGDEPSEINLNPISMP